MREQNVSDRRGIPSGAHRHVSSGVLKGTCDGGLGCHLAAGAGHTATG